MSPSLRIVVADDDPDVLEAYCHFLPAIGHTVVGTGTSASELMEACAQQRPDLVLTDLSMPGMDGVNASFKLAALKPIPVILVTGHGEQGAVYQDQEDHVRGYLVKPIRMSQLEAAIIAAISTQGGLPPAELLSPASPASRRV